MKEVYSNLETTRSDRNGRRNVLLVAFHYPPCASSSGLQRALSFSIHLRDFGWQPHVLTVNPVAHPIVDDNQLRDIPPDVTVLRMPALDSARHLAIGGHHWARLAIPDRWSTWRFTGIPVGINFIRRASIDVIWSTYPIATAHSIGATLAQRTGLPWIADFRDPMVERHPKTGEPTPRDPVLRKARLEVEARSVQFAKRLVFCTNSARKIVLDRYVTLAPNRTAVIPNGFEELAFRDAEKLAVMGSLRKKRVLLHSGVIYRSPDRDPTHLFRALRRLLLAGEICPDSFELRLRDPSNERYFQTLAIDEGVGSVVNVFPPISYREALAEMMSADGLLLLQGETSNPAIPAKLYEYLRARRPIIALVHAEGESARLLQDIRITSVASLTDPSVIESLLRRWLNRTSDAPFLAASDAEVARHSRKALTRKLAELLDEAVKVGASSAK